MHSSREEVKILEEAASGLEYKLKLQLKELHPAERANTETGTLSAFGSSSSPANHVGCLIDAKLVKGMNNVSICTSFNTENSLKQSLSSRFVKLLHAVGVLRNSSIDVPRLASAQEIPDTTDVNRTRPNAWDVFWHPQTFPLVLDNSKV